jgi:hypothetical protein
MTQTQPNKTKLNSLMLQKTGNDDDSIFWKIELTQVMITIFSGNRDLLQKSRHNDL